MKLHSPKPSSLLLGLFLAACDHIDIHKPIEVDIPISVPCGNGLPAEPQWALSTTSPDADIADQGKAALVEINQREAYEDRLKAQIAACSVL